MATYSCKVCDMAVNATCAKCNIALVNDLLKLEDGTTVQIANVLVVRVKSSLRFVAVKI